MNSQDLRAAFIDFFRERGHAHVPSASLIPDEMSTTLFTIAGMEPFVPVFLGERAPVGPRAVTVQRCLRVAGAKSDIENVGRTGRHGTFLEMLGNFSFGDYYKAEAIRYAWEFLTAVLGLPPEKLYVTVHTGDDEAQELWEREIGLPPERITRFDDDNFWTMGATGPCGPCSEIFFDTGEANAGGPEDRGPNLGNRYVEIWNLVFQQYNRGADGSLTELPKKNIDTGAGFERLLAVCNGKASMYETDLFTDLVAAQPAPSDGAVTGSERLVLQRIIADHARATTFLIADGVYPSNTDRGYVLRFLIRRAIRSGRLLGYPDGFFSDLVPAVVGSLGTGYSVLAQRQEAIVAVLRAEEATFGKTLERGSEMLARLIERAKEAKAPIPGRDVFTLHDTYGFPSALTREIAGEAGVAIDEATFASEMQAQRERARADALGKRAVVAVSAAGPTAASEFVGYDGLEVDGFVRSIVRLGADVAALHAGEEAQIVLDRTPFYAEKGGQIGDQGTILVTGENGERALFRVTDVQFAGEAIAHVGTLETGTIARGDAARASVDPIRRREIRRHHTSAHLLQRALKDVLGDEVVQAGSWVGVDRMRFDFRSPGGALSAEERRVVAGKVNAMIREDHHAVTHVLSQEEARATGAISMAGESYGDRVRVIAFGPSVEFCGGTHAHATGELGMFLIVSEGSVGSGIRRIEAVVSDAAEAYALDRQALVDDLASTLATKPAEIGERIARMQSEMRDLQRSVETMQSRLAAADAQTYLAAAENLGGLAFVGAIVPEANAESVRSLATAIRQKLRGVVALIGTTGETASIVVLATEDAVARGVHAGNLVRAAAERVGGKGGGQPAQAQGGGKEPAGAEAALAVIRGMLAPAP